MTSTLSGVTRHQASLPLLLLDEHAAEIAPAALLTEYPGLLLARRRLLDHPVYRRVDTIEKLRTFMQDHVFAVWDFMSLMKRLQQELTCVRVPWQCPSDAVMARFVNEIVLNEESDEGPDGVPMSHLQLYLAAMEEIGADTTVFARFDSLLRSGESPRAALIEARVPIHVQNFVLNTLEVAQTGRTIEVIAAFLYGREDVIPDMFQHLLTAWNGRRHLIRHFAYYLERHIALDGDDHGPAARRLLERAAGGDSGRWRAAGRAASRAIESRIDLWDGLLQAIEDATGESAEAS